MSQTAYGVYGVTVSVSRRQCHSVSVTASVSRCQCHGVSVTVSVSRCLWGQRLMLCFRIVETDVGGKENNVS